MPFRIIENTCILIFVIFRHICTAKQLLSEIPCVLIRVYTSHILRRTTYFGNSLFKYIDTNSSQKCILVYFNLKLQGIPVKLLEYMVITHHNVKLMPIIALLLKSSTQKVSYNRKNPFRLTCM